MAKSPDDWSRETSAARHVALLLPVQPGEVSFERPVYRPPPAVQARLEAASDFDADELELVRGVLSEPAGLVTELAQRLFDGWDDLSVPERTAGLLLLAQELARADATADGA